MNKIDVNICDKLGEKTYSTTLSNGLNVYICKKPGFKKKIGLFGTKYGSVINEFYDINTDERTKVPDGVAHFLEHKLFEQEGANALDLFSKIGVSSNAYTSFDHTVYFFETIEKYEESLELLIKLVRTPYFTDENVEKEKGIIGQEISMYDDEPNYKCYFNALQAMYQNNPVKIDIAGTIESISKIDKDTLYKCYNTFYSMSNMFFIVVGDVDVDKTIAKIEKEMKKYDDKSKTVNKEVKVITIEEPSSINKDLIQKNMEVYMQNLCIGYKLDLASGKELLKRQIVSEIIYDMYFSKLSKFYEEQYNKGLVNEDIAFSYEGTDKFSHIIIMAETTDAQELAKNIVSYITAIKDKKIDTEMFNIIKKKKIGETLILSDSIECSYRRIIDKVLMNTSMYDDLKIIENITEQDIKDFINLLDSKVMVKSIIKHI